MLKSNHHTPVALLKGYAYNKIMQLAPSIIRNGKATVTTAGTRVALGSGTVHAVVVRALSTNTDVIYVGNSSVAAANGYTLEPGESIGIAIDSLSRVYLDAVVSGEGVVYVGS